MNLLATAVAPLIAGLPLAIGVLAHGTRIGRRGEAIRPRRWEASCILTGAILLSVYFALLAPNLSTLHRTANVAILLGAVAGNAWLIYRPKRKPHA